jgi:myotubularin-related protein 1/2
LCETYPQHIAVPYAFCDEDIREASTFRSRGRLPCVTYRHAATGAVISRSAQPLVGLIQKSSQIDQALLCLYRLHGASLDPK